MRIFAMAVIAALVSSSVRAQDQEATHMSGRENKQPGAPGYQQVQDGDKQFARAHEQAQRTLGLFIAALKKKRNGDSGFELKKTFVDGDKVEHIWLRDVTYDGQNFRAKVDNQPMDVKNVRLGQTVTVTPHDVTDWMFVKDGKLIGGYTTRVLYARLTPEQRAEFDREADFRIEERLGQ